MAPAPGRQVVEACKAYLPPQAASRVLAAAAASPFWEEPVEDEAAEMASDLEHSPLEAEARMATDL